MDSVTFWARRRSIYQTDSERKAENITITLFLNKSFFKLQRKRLLKLAESGANNKEDATKAESNGNVPFPRHPGLEVNPGEGR